MKNLYIIFTIVMFLFLFSNPLLAQQDVILEDIKEDSFHIEADKIYIDSIQKKMHAKGNAFFFSKEFKIKAAELVFDYENKLINASGDPIDLIYGEKKLTGKSLQLDYSKETLTISDSEVDIEKLHFKGKKINYLHNQDLNITVDEAYYTTCIMEDPHYHYTADSIYYYPDDKIVGKKIGLWWRNTKIITLPRYAINIETDEQGNTVVKNTFPVPKIGFDGERGFFIELYYPYELSSSNYGNVHYLIEDRDNASIDLNHIYRINNKVQFYFDYNKRKYLDNNDILNKDGYYQLGLNYRYNKNINYKLYFKGYEKTEPISSANNKRLLRFNINYSNSDYVVDTEIGHNFKNNFNDVKLNIKYDKYNWLFKYVKEDTVQYLGQVSYNNNNYDWRLKYLKGSNTEYLPYGNINYNINSNISVSLGYGYITEGDVKQHKINYGLYFNKNFKLNENMSFDFSQKIDHISYYEDNSDLTNYESTISMKYNKQLFDLLSLNQRLGYNMKYKKGEPLFGIDDINLERKITSYTEFDLYFPKNKENWNLSFDLGYSILDNKFDKQKVGITHEYDCYEYQVSYNFTNQSIGLEFNFKN